MKSDRIIFLIGLTIIIFLISFPTNAGARRGGGFMWIGFGEYISPVIDLPYSEYEGMDIGYYYYSIKIFFIPIMAFDGKFVLYKGDYYRDVTEWEIKVFEAEYGSLYSEVNLWIRYVNWLWFLVLFFIIASARPDLIKEWRKKINLRKIYKLSDKTDFKRSKERVKESEQKEKAEAPLKKECSICGNHELLLFKCSYCKNIYCSDHQLPENHNCPELCKNK